MQQCQSNSSQPSVEDIEIGSHQNSWNRAGKNSRQHLRAIRPHRTKAQKKMTRVVRLESYTLQGGILTLETDSNKLVMANKFILHSYRARLRTGQARKYSRSETTATVLLSSDSHIETLKGAMKWASKQ